MAQAKSKYYVVWVGKQTGIFRTWPECQEQVKGIQDAKYKSYESLAEAEAALAAGWQKSLRLSAKAKAAAAAGGGEANFNPDSLSVDVGCSGNPGIVEYKGVDTQTGEVLFYQGPIAKGTNNLGEFLAIVHALAYLKKRGSNKTIYTDSMTALSWIRKKEVATNLPRDKSTEEIWALVDRALQWLRTNTYENAIVKWDTKRWGEIKADFGRK
ncbi:ribonuclease H [Paenibacillus chartarius]|uniref:Ribonuclease H n=1 Tax=Paenibacillus chartarius TaxID=747481 RepID=A0ABV6DF14_9BACL